MTSSGLLIVFVALMGVLAMLAIGIDWLGKPIRNRKFQPRIYRYPDEAMTVTVDPTATTFSEERFALPEATPAALPHIDSTGASDWSDAQFAAPAVETADWGLLGETMERDERNFAELFGEPVADPVAADPGPWPELDSGEDVPTPVTFQTLPQGSKAQPTGLVDPAKLVEAGGWAPGDSIFAPTADEMPPDETTISARFWRATVTLMAGSQWYGDEGIDRMTRGLPPQRRNRRTGHVETLDIGAVPTVDGTQAARPHWPDEHVDPFLT